MGVLANTGIAASGAGGIGTGHFPDPFCDVASLAFPQTIQDALRWTEFIATKLGPYREAVRRILAYFLTDIEVMGPSGKKVGREEKQKYLDYLNDTLGIRLILEEVGLDFMIYGNSFTSLLCAFRRYLACRGSGCGAEYPLRYVFNNARFKFGWENLRPVATCPRCGARGPWEIRDRRRTGDDQLTVRRWSPYDIDLLWDPFTNRVTDYVWRIPDDYRTQLQRGYLQDIENAPVEVLDAVRGNQSLLFDKDMIYHMAEPSLAGIRARGWGISKVLSNFSLAWYLQVLLRYNEAIALDYIVPFRVLTPAARPGAMPETSDPVLSINLGGFTARVNNLLAEHRRDPARWNVLPFPLEYNALGGDAQALAPKELIDQGFEMLMNATGIPVDLYKGTLTMQNMPGALRVFEATWPELPFHLNRFLNRLVTRVSQVMSWEPVRVRLQRVKHADDLNRQMAQLQLMGMGRISNTTGLATVGLDFVEETRRQAEEARITAEIQQEEQADMQQAATAGDIAMPSDAVSTPAQGGGAPPAPQGAASAAPPQQGGPSPGAAAPAGGLPGSGAANVQQLLSQLGPQGGQSKSMDQLTAAATQIAQTLFVLPQTQRESTLINLKKQNSVLHALTKSQLDELSRQAKQQGGELVRQQMGGQ